MKRFLIALALISLLSALAYGVWRGVQPVRIDAVHTGKYSSDILVSNFPLTDRGRIEWWENNKAQLMTDYGVPKPNDEGYVSVMFWAWDGVYRIYGSVNGDSDLFCFEDKPEEARCIIKSDQPLQVSQLSDGRIIYYIGRDHHAVYSRKFEGAELVRRQQD